MNFIAFDCETGGTDPKVNPILTAYFAIVNEHYAVLDELYLEIKPESPYLNVDEAALKHNGIVLEDHLAKAEGLLDAHNKLLEFLKKHKGKGAGNKLRPLGQNLDFDFNFIFTQLIRKEEWEKYVHYIVYDTKRISDFLKIADLMPSDIGTLGSMVDYYGIPKQTLHHAKNDVLLTIQVFEKMVSSVKGLSKNSSANPINWIELLER